MEKSFLSAIEDAKKALGIEKYQKISEEELKKYYHKAMLRVHPDINQNMDDATEKAKEVNNAYALLKKYFAKKTKEDKTNPNYYEPNVGYEECDYVNPEITKAIKYLKDTFKFDLRTSQSQYIIMQQEYLKGMFESLIRDLKWKPMFGDSSKQEIVNKVKSYKNEYARVIHEIFNNTVSEYIPFISNEDKNALFVKLKGQILTVKTRSFNQDISNMLSLISDFLKNESMIKSKLVLWVNERMYNINSSFIQQPGYSENIFWINDYKMNLFAKITKIIQDPKFMDNYENNVEYIMDLVNLDYTEFLSNTILDHTEFLKQRIVLLNNLELKKPINIYHEDCIRRYKLDLQNCINATDFNEINRIYNEKFEHYMKIEKIKKEILKRLYTVTDIKVKNTAIEVIDALEDIMKYEKFGVDYQILANISMDSNNFSKVMDLFKSKMLNLEVSLSNGYSRKRGN